MKESYHSSSKLMVSREKKIEVKYFGQFCFPCFSQGLKQKKGKRGGEGCAVTLLVSGLHFFQGSYVLGHETTNFSTILRTVL